MGVFHSFRDLVRRGVHTGALDTTPDHFTFVDVTGASGTVESNLVMVTGINTGAPMSVSGAGDCSVNGGPFTKLPAVVHAGDVLKLRVSMTAGNNKQTTVTIGGVSDTWSVRKGH